jgi:hypothetical protein
MLCPTSEARFVPCVQLAMFEAGEISATEMRDRVICRARERSKD